MPKNIMKDKTIEIDGKTFSDTVFVSCVLVYRGQGPVNFVNCEFVSYQFRFAGPAGDTFEFLRALYHDGATKVVDAVFNDIKNNRPLGTTKH